MMISFLLGLLAEWMSREVDAVIKCTLLVNNGAVMPPKLQECSKEPNEIKTWWIKMRRNN